MCVKLRWLVERRLEHLKGALTNPCDNKMPHWSQLLSATLERIIDYDESLDRIHILQSTYAFALFFQERRLAPT